MRTLILSIAFYLAIICIFFLSSSSLAFLILSISLSVKWVSKTIKIRQNNEIWTLTFELLVFTMVKLSNLFRCRAIRIIPNIIIYGSISIETVLDLDCFTMISDLLGPFRRRPPALLLHAFIRSGTNMPFPNQDFSIKPYLLTSCLLKTQIRFQTSNQLGTSFFLASLFKFLNLFKIC